MGGIHRIQLINCFPQGTQFNVDYPLETTNRSQQQLIIMQTKKVKAMTK